MNLSRRGFLRAAGITTASIWIPQLWAPRTEIRSATESRMALMGDYDRLDALHAQKVAAYQFDLMEYVRVRYGSAFTISRPDFKTYGPDEADEFIIHAYSPGHTPGTVIECEPDDSEEWMR